MPMDLQSEIENMVKDYVVYEPGIDSPSKPLKELGFDSLDLMDMIFSIEKKYKVRTSFEDMDLQEITVQKIVDVVHSQQTVS